MSDTPPPPPPAPTPDAAGPAVPPPPPAGPPAPAQPSAPQAGQPYPGHAPLPPYGYPAARPTNAVAIVALVLGIVTGVGGIIAGHIALSQIRRTGEQGRGMALAGLIIGYVFTGFWVLYFLIILVVLFTTLGTAASFATLTG